MDILGAILIICFVALLLVTAVTFGFAIITACLIITAITMVMIIVRQAWRRWRFTQASTPREVIDGEYRHIPHKNGEEI